MGKWGKVKGTPQAWSLTTEKLPKTLPLSPFHSLASQKKKVGNNSNPSKESAPESKIGRFIITFLSQIEFGKILKYLNIIS
ncbi:MAG: hypothetical protein ACUVXA_07065 [Candidatus Jordarchaeum sp.]